MKKIRILFPIILLFSCNILFGDELLKEGKPSTPDKPVKPEKPVYEEAAKELADLSRISVQANDLRNAINLLVRARELASPKQWQAYTLELIQLQLMSKNFGHAEDLLNEFRKKYPDADTIPIKLLEVKKLLYTGKYVEAAKFGNELITSGDLNRNQLIEVLNDIATAKMGSEDYKDAAAQFERLGKMAITRPKEFYATTSKIYALQLGGDLEESSKQLTHVGKFNSDEEQLIIQKLTLHQLLLEKKYPEFNARYDDFVRRYPSLPSDQLLFDLTHRAGELYVELNDIATATKYFGEAFKFSTNDGERKNIFRRQVNINLKAKRYKEAADIISYYLNLYPNSGDRSLLILEKARLLTAGNLTKEALNAYEALIQEDNLQSQLRVIAAREAGVLAGKEQMEQKANTYLRQMIANATSSKERQEGYFLLGEQNYRLGLFGRAAESFLAASEEDGPLREKSVFWRLQSLIKAENYELAFPVAQSLHEAEDPQLRGAAEYFQAYILEQTGDSANAIIAYDSFIKNFSSSDFSTIAHFDAALIAAKNKDYNNAATRFYSFYEKYPENPKAANALHRAIQMAFYTGNIDLISKSINGLVKDYPSSKFTISALLLNVDYLKSTARYNDALEVLDDIEELEIPKDNDILAQLMFDRALIYNNIGNINGALSLGNEILEKYPESGVAADASRLAADIYSEQSEFGQAAKLYERAKTLRPSGRFAIACVERQADCEFSSYMVKHGEKSLEKAIELYKLLLEKHDSEKVFPVLYKLGRSYEEKGESQDALDCYGEVLYRALAMRRNDEPVSSIWCSKAAYSAILLNIKKGNSKGAREALRVIDLFKSLNLGTGETFQDFTDAIQKKYKI